MLIKVFSKVSKKITLKHVCFTLIFFIIYLIEMINDWASKSNPDILHFVPYTWKFSVLMKEFELITISNEYNWIDCSSQKQENGNKKLFNCSILFLC